MEDREGTADNAATAPLKSADEIICYGCRGIVKKSSLSCPSCGAVFEAYLLSLITAKSLAGPDAEAFHKGVKDCNASRKLTKQTDISRALYKPPEGLHDAYRAGWKAEADRLDGKVKLTDILGLLRTSDSGDRKALSFVLMSGGLALFLIIDQLHPPDAVLYVLTPLMAIGVFGGLILYFSSN